MLFVLSKTISFVLKPIGILFLLALLSFITKNRTKKKRLNGAFLILLYFFSCPAIINKFIQAYEFPSAKIQNTKNYTYGILLTGGLVNESKSQDSALFLGPQGDRLWQTVELYRANKIKKIIISGGDGYERQSLTFATENDKAREFLLKSGVDAEDILREKDAVNTYENAKFTKKLLPQKTEKVLVITSGFHLKRAIACFKKQNIDADGFATTPISENYPFKWQDFIPTMDAFKNLDILANEMIGLAVYKTLGYI
ncbi:YdcF family protein [Lacihabitans soyangensis]|uniref:YdcF family protein n=1 Tax=Lacihabitans soyangensis TaxID=869394 RepID=A0AAE3H7E5_9BACT|nr:YdcF family protein [Lacihabitans soyangensis]MCP9764415.1 YdcF family protein [Lacihabitans soyangensis]